MFIICNKTVKFTAANGAVWEMKPGFIGEVPKWVSDHWYFKKLEEEHSITHPASRKDKDIQAAAEEPKADANKPGTGGAGNANGESGADNTEIKDNADGGKPPKPAKPPKPGTGGAGNGGS